MRPTVASSFPSPHHPVLKPCSSLQASNGVVKGPDFSMGVWMKMDTYQHAGLLGQSQASNSTAPGWFLFPRQQGLVWFVFNGFTEWQCGTLTARLKGPGMRWDSTNAEAMMALACIYHSGLWETYWKSERRVAKGRQDLSSRTPYQRYNVSC